MSKTQTATTTIAITSNDPKVVMNQVVVELNRICKLAAYVEVEHEITQLIKPLSLLALSGVLEAICLQFHVDGILVREYRYELSVDPITGSGPPPTQPPFPRTLPPGTRVRIAVEPNLALDKEQRRRAFERVGWAPIQAIEPDGPTETSHYGSFGSGGFGVNRCLKRNTRRDLD